MDRRWIYDEHCLPEGDSERTLGGKGSALLRLLRSGQPVPPFFVISTTVMRELLLATGERAGRSDPARLWQVLQQSEFPPELREQVQTAMQRHFPSGGAVSVRSSAVGEDNLQHSFAGIFDTRLGVGDIEAVCTAILQVWASAFGPRAIAYRQRMGLPPLDVEMAVIVQEMVDARRAGVCFTCDPASGATDVLMIQTVLGAGEGLVSHGLPADTFTVSKDLQQITTQVAEKQEQWLLDRPCGGLRRELVSNAERWRASLDNEQVRQVATAALAIAAAEGRPQDVEFCFDAEGVLWILQTRPVTVVRGEDPHAAGPSQGNELVWDNSNIIESYSGVTTPMTFSFIRRAYSIVYHCFAEVMGISPQVVAEHRDTFENMLGLFRGRVYYNLKNWYRLVSLFPGYRYNRRFMEAMMGLKDPLLLAEDAQQPGALRRWFVELPGLLKLLTRSGTNFLLIRRKVSAFQEHFQRHFDQWSQVDFDTLEPHEIMKAYSTLEDALLWNWKAPIINDFYVMVFYGVLKKMCTQWCDDETGSLQNGLICGEGGLQSDQPARMLLQMAAVARADAALRTLVLETDVTELPPLVAADGRFSEFNRLMAQYLDEYGLRCVGELKLEELSYRDEPHRLYQLIRDYLVQDGAALQQNATLKQRESDVRAAAERQYRDAFSRSPRGLLRRMLFTRVLRNARLGIRNRENMRFARTRIYGLLREMLRSIGRRLASAGVIDARDDIFYLTIDEVWDYLKGTAVSTDLRGLAALRRSEYDSHRSDSVPAPDDHFVTRGMPYHANSLRNGVASGDVATGERLRGIGCCPGIVTGRVHVVGEGAGSDGFRGDILVAERTDPGWVPLYPAYSGILIERGSVLSHSAIVAREMGIPTIVSIRGLTQTLRSGQLVRMDGRTGTIELIDASADGRDTDADLQKT